jgi:Uma2 family endonuclease
MPKILMLDSETNREMIRDRQRRGIDRHDEVWDGVYVMPPAPNNDHQSMVGNFVFALKVTVELPGLGRVLPGPNVSDRRRAWKKNFRCPDVVVVLQGGRAVDCGTHWLGGPDFLIEVQSPGDETPEKIPFHSSLGVRELLVVQRDSRELTLYRHDGTTLVEVNPEGRNGRGLLRSAVVPLTFRLRVVRGVGPRVEVVRTDGTAQTWLV